MGSLLTRQKNAVDELETIVSKLEQLKLRSYQLEQSRYKILWWLTAIALFVSSVYSAIICMKNTQNRYLHVTFTWFTGILLLLIVRFVMAHFFDYIQRRDQKSMEELNTKRSKIIEQVMENEKFKVAKEIIQKYGSPQDLAEIGVQRTDGKKADPNATQKPPIPKQSSDSAAAHRQATNADASTSKHPMAQHDQTFALIERPPSRMGAMNLAFNTPAIRRQPVRPFIQPMRTPIDKLVDFIIGDGPSNRFALICRQCHVHNGMALREEFYSIAYICYNCGLYNAPKKADPMLRTPKGPSKRLAIADASPVSQPLIRTATNSESSDNEDDDDESGVMNDEDMLTAREDTNDDKTLESEKPIESASANEST